MLRFKSIKVLTLSLGGMFFLQSCGGKDSDRKGGPMDGGGQQALTDVKADFSGAVGVLVIDPNQATSSLRLIGGDSAFANLSLAETGSGNGDGSLAKVGSDGEVKPAISSGDDEEENTNGWCCKPKLPSVKTIAISPNKEIYLHFENPFIYKAPDDGNWSNAWDYSSGNMCQIFKVKGGTIEELIANPPEDAGNLECLDNMHFVDSWQAQRNSVFQFDDQSNVYYPGSIPNGNGKMVVYKRTPDGKVSEMINSNICVQDFLVTKSGGIFYTGSSNCQNSNGSSGGFFRYVSPTNSIVEIARDWWNFVFEPSASATGDKAVFFGPDPTSSKTASWDSACLFNFDPNGGSTASDRITPAITCGSDIWSWINMSRASDEETYGTGYSKGNGSPSDAWITEFKTRCESSGQVFAGGGSQISSIKQTSAGEIYVIGQVRKKKEGELTCGLNVRGSHCVLKGIPYLYGDASYGAENSCQGAGGVWTEEGYCSNSSYSTRDTCTTNNASWYYREVNYNNVASALCGATSGGSLVASNDFYNGSHNVTATNASPLPTPKYSRGWMNCQVKSDGSSSNGHDWLEEYKGLAKVNNSTKTLSLLSGTNEQAINLWLVGDQPYFSSFNTSDGKYYLKKYENGSAVTIAENFEAYNLSASGENGKLYYDGLDFSTNAYSFGTMLEAAPYTRTIKTGLTGTVKTIVILSP
jgi:hypothetical protein